MLRSSFYTAGVVLLGATAFAQRNLSGQLRPITAPVKYAGVYHLGTGTWTQAAGGGSVGTAAPGIIYDNTCNTGFYTGIVQNGRFYDEGRLPSTGSVVIANSFGLGNDSEIGTQNSYTVDGFQMAYCTNNGGAGVTVSYNVNFYEAYDACTVAPATPTASFAVTGLPASATAGTQACWLVDLDLCAASLSFNMQGDADSIYAGSATGVGDTFGWSLQLVTPSNADGPIIAGGQATAGSYATCSGSDGTVFDSGTVSPIYPANSDAILLGCGTLSAGSSPESGTGMTTQDRFRIENSAPTADGCYWFLGNPIGSFHLQLYSGNVTLPTSSSMIPFCDPSSGGVANCPCGNPPAGSGRGCDNSSATGGASISATGSASLATDTLVFQTANQRPTGTTILLQGNATIATGASFGQGVRCVGGTLKRLYVKTASGGSITAPQPGDPNVHTRSAALGDPIAAGTHRYYAAYYRDPIVLGGCNPSFTFNITNSGDVLWN